MNHKRDNEDMQQPDLESLVFEKADDVKADNAQAEESKADSETDDSLQLDGNTEDNQNDEKNNTEKQTVQEAIRDDKTDFETDQDPAAASMGKKPDMPVRGTKTEKQPDAKRASESEAQSPDWMKRFESMPYEEAVALLEKIVSRLESSELSLDESVTLFQQGMHLARICAGRLNEIEGKITKLIENEQEKMEEAPFDLD